VWHAETTVACRGESTNWVPSSLQPPLFKSSKEPCGLRREVYVTKGGGLFHRSPIRFWVTVAVCPWPSVTVDGWGGFRDTYTIRYGWYKCPTHPYGWVCTRKKQKNTQTHPLRMTDDGWGVWATHTIRYGWRMGGLPEPIRVRHPSTDRTSVVYSRNKDFFFHPEMRLTSGSGRTVTQDNCTHFHEQVSDMDIKYNHPPTSQEHHMTWHTEVVKTGMRLVLSSVLSS
jgi:hypothetical protein